MEHDEIGWTGDGHSSSIGLERAGRGATVVLLPALSSISTRQELRPLQARLSDSYATVAVDWPGFGTLPKPRVNWRPALYDAFLEYLLENVAPDAYAVVAAGHAAGYALRYLARAQRPRPRLVLLSPTWRGPLPTMLGGGRRGLERVARAFDGPLWGELLYRLNVNRPMIGVMARGHVYADPRWLDAKRMALKLAVTRARGARHGSARFVTGCLDPFVSREQQSAAATRVALPTLVLYAEGAPRKSRLEMEALAEALPDARTLRVPRGKLSFYEEFPEQAAIPILAFLAADGEVR